MKKFFSKKNILIIVFLLIVIMVTAEIGLHIFFNTKKVPNMEKMEYRTDIQPLSERLSDIVTIKSCYWKADIIGKTNFGTSSYWMKGFIITDSETLYKFKTNYKFEKADVHFDKGMSPNVTGFDSFHWNYNKDLSNEISGIGFIGECYLDTNNGVIYFDLESN